MEFENIRQRIKNGCLMKFLKKDEENEIFDFFRVNKTLNPYKYNSVEKNIHFIWIGSIIPDKYIKNIKTYIKNNKNYKIYLWVSHDIIIESVTVKNITELHIINNKEYNIASHYGSKADILRYEIIYNYGGIYCDIDSVSLKEFDINFEKDTVSYIYPGWNNLTNAFFCFSKNNPFLLYCIQCLPYVMQFNLQHHFLTGPTFITTCFYYYNNNNINLIHQSKIIHRSEDGYTYHTNDANWKKQEL